MNVCALNALECSGKKGEKSIYPETETQRQIEREMREKLGSLNTMQLIYYFHMGEMSIREPKDFKRKANEKATTFNRIVNGFFSFFCLSHRTE